jgi:hypothetical protein
MLVRILPERWRVLLLLTAPFDHDPPRALAHRHRFRALLGAGEELSAAAFYFPWVLSQERVGAPVRELPPTAFAAGVIARRDLARGPHVSPANETLTGVVGLTRAIDDELHGAFNQSPNNINVLRTFPGYGVQIWGARTLSEEKWLRYLAVRRCLSAIERRAFVSLQPAVFEPNTVFLWVQVTHILLGILLDVYEGGALRGDDAARAFYVRCDSSNNPPEAIARGELLAEVGVAIAAPAEFIVFRIGRKEGVVEVVE